MEAAIHSAMIAKPLDSEKPKIAPAVTYALTAMAALVATSCNSARSALARLPPNAASNRACAAFQPAVAARRRAAPALVNFSSLLRRSTRAGAMAIKPSRSSGRMLRPSVVRSITNSAASAVTTDVLADEEEAALSRLPAEGVSSAPEPPRVLALARVVLGRREVLTASVLALVFGM